jgi:hypothetical protein
MYYKVTQRVSQHTSLYTGEAPDKNYQHLIPNYQTFHP